MPANIVITRKEALNILGLRKSSLFFLERISKIPIIADRIGYTHAEFRALINNLRKTLGP